jgi:hypothetical protein
MATSATESHKTAPTLIPKSDGVDKKEAALSDALPAAADSDTVADSAPAVTGSATSAAADAATAASALIISFNPSVSLRPRARPFG